MIMAERDDPKINKKDQSSLDDDQFSISEVEQHLASSSAEFLDITKNDKENTKGSIETRREENPFSFKHFLKRDTPSTSNSTSTSSGALSHNHINHNTGAKPKVYTASVGSALPNDSFRAKKCNHSIFDERCMQCCPQNYKNCGKTNSVENITISNVDNHLKNLYRSYSDRDTKYIDPNYSQNDSNNVTGRGSSSEFSSALPDFVQDHIVLEQWYSGFDNPLSTENVEREIKTVFSPFEKDFKKKYVKNPIDSMPQQEIKNNSNLAPLDLPLNDNITVNSTFSNPLDLPATISLDLTGNVKEVNLHSEYNGMQEVPNTLPDFLSDGAIHSDRLADLVQASPKLQGGRRDESDSDDISETVSRLSLENNRLRRELDRCRRQISEQSSQITRLQSELNVCQKNEGQYTTKLATALETVEKNMARSNKRAIDAESTVAKLKKQISQMTSEMMSLRSENTSLRFGPVVNDSNSMMRLSSELRSAASTAESSLRQLLTGVDNLRTLASSLESSNRIFEPSDDNFCENEDEEAGPAL